MAERAVQELGGELREAFMIGDHASDMAMGRAVGATTIQVRTGHGERYAQEAAPFTDHRAEDLWCAALIVERLARNALQNVKGAVT
jgi:phosphoglycolate phosphatase-like HAD superfamily hydrolase